MSDLLFHDNGVMVQVVYDGRIEVSVFRLPRVAFDKIPAKAHHIAQSDDFWSKRLAGPRVKATFFTNEPPFPPRPPSCEAAFPGSVPA